MILAAFVLVALAVVVPEFVLHGWRRGVVAILWVVAVAAAIVGLLMALAWLLDAGNGKQGGWGDRVSRGFRFLLRFLLFGFLAGILATALVAGHGLGADGENRVLLVSGILGGLVGCFFHFRLGASRFWGAFGGFCLALFGSLVLGILGILLPGDWGPDLGILLPILIFVVLALAGRVVPPRDAEPPSPS